MKNRSDLTTTLVSQLPTPSDYKTAMSFWWYNSQATGGFRLTDYGFDIFVGLLDLEYYTWDFPSPNYMTQRILLGLDRNMKFPYYIEKKNKKDLGRLYMFGSKEAVMINLCGDLKTFVKNLAK